MNKMILVASSLSALLLAGCGQEPAPPAAAEAPATVPAPVASPGGLVPAFHRLAVDAAPAGYCSLDALNDQRGPRVTLPASGQAWFGGWVADADRQIPTSALLVFRDAAGDAMAVPLATGAHRPDVAAALDSDALASAGFNVRVALDGLPTGSHDLLVVVDPATSAYCDLKTALVLE